MYYSLLEQHSDGSWWLHKGICNYQSKEEAEQAFTKWFGGWDPARPHRIIEHKNPYPNDMSRCTNDDVHFEFAGGEKITLE